jgi:hypothetical protein
MKINGLQPGCGTKWSNFAGSAAMAARQFLPGAGQLAATPAALYGPAPGLTGQQDEEQDHAF